MQLCAARRCKTLTPVSAPASKNESVHRCQAGMAIVAVVALACEGSMLPAHLDGAGGRVERRGRAHVVSSQRRTPVASSGEEIEVSRSIRKRALAGAANVIVRAGGAEARLLGLGREGS